MAKCSFHCCGGLGSQVLATLFFLVLQLSVHCQCHGLAARHLVERQLIVEVLYLATRKISYTRCLDERSREVLGCFCTLALDGDAEGTELAQGNGITILEFFHKLFHHGDDDSPYIGTGHGCTYTDGVGDGFDIEMLRAVSEVADVPIVASGGAGSIEDFITLFNTLPGVDAGLAATIFHFGKIKIPDLKASLRDAGISVRYTNV